MSSLVKNKCGAATQSQATAGNFWQQKFLNKIVCDDAVSAMKEIPDGTIDLVITSPPYNLKNSTGNGMKKGSKGKWANAALQNGYANHDDCMPHEKYVEWQKDCLSEMMRVISDEGAIFYNHKSESTSAFSLESC